MSIIKLTGAGATLAALGAIVVACGGGDVLDVQSGTVIQNVTVVNTRDGSLAKGMSVVIDGGKIQHVTGGALRIGGTATTIDASGKFLVPGYLDMHTHSMENADANPSDWPMYIANGVTGVRQMSGSPAIIARTRQLNADSAAGRVTAPEVVMVPGTIFGGQAPTEAGARAFVQDQKKAGADFVKMVAGNRVALTGLLDEAKKNGLTVSGHLPITIPASEMSAMGMRSVEHLGGGVGQLLDCSAEETTVRQAILAAPPVQLGLGGPVSPHLFDANAYESFYRSILNSYNEDKCKALAATFIKNNTWQVPTLIRVRTMAFNTDAVYRNDPNLVYVSKTTRALWTQLANMYASDVRPSAAAVQQQYYPLQVKSAILFKRQGVKTLVGTDAGGIWLVPGVSMHQEFRELASAGMTPLEVLQAATLNGAEYLGRESTMGSVDAGKKGDLVLLDANPVDDVANLGKISGVMLGGKYFAKPALDKLKDDVAKGHAAQPLGSVKLLAESGHQH
ncbi:MAG: amidohydrolase family protein [Pseudomonadota bacterium]